MSKRGSKKRSTKSIIRGAVQKIQKQFPLINKKMIELYVSYLISIHGYKDNLDVNAMAYHLDEHINKNLYNMDSLIQKYSDKLSASFGSCPCGR